MAQRKYAKLMAAFCATHSTVAFETNRATLPAMLKHINQLRLSSASSGGQEELQHVETLSRVRPNEIPTDEPPTINEHKPSSNIRACEPDDSPSFDAEKRHKASGHVKNNRPDDIQRDILAHFAEQHHIEKVLQQVLLNQEKILDRLQRLERLE